jgi:hypothetical protein
VAWDDVCARWGIDDLPYAQLLQLAYLIVYGCLPFCSVWSVERFLEHGIDWEVEWIEGTDNEEIMLVMVGLGMGVTAEDI